MHSRKNYIIRPHTIMDGKMPAEVAGVEILTERMSGMEILLRSTRINQ
jgi:hypothetical protein